MSKNNGVEAKEAKPYRPKNDYVVDEFKSFRQLMKHLIDWHENGVGKEEYTIDIMNLPPEDEAELQRYLKDSPYRSPGSLTDDMTMRLRNRATRMGLFPMKMRVRREGTKVTICPSSGQNRRNKHTWEYVKK